MRTVVLLISLAFMCEYNTEAYTPVDLLGLLNSQIKNMTALISIIKKTYADDPYHHPLPRQYLATLDRAQWALDDARNSFERPKFLRKETLYNTQMEKERRNPRRALKMYPGWYPQSKRSFGVIEDSDEDRINPPPWANERWDNRRSIDYGWPSKRNHLRDSTDRINDDREWDADFYNVLLKILSKEFKDEPVISKHIREGYEPPIVYNTRGV